MSRTLRSPIMLLAAFLGFGGCALASSVATIEVKGAEQTGDASTIAISFSDSSGNTYSRTISYGQFSTAASVAATIGASFANAYVPGGKLSAQVYCGTTSIIEFKLSGTATFGNLTVTGSTASFQLGSYGFASSGSRTTPTITWPTPAAITSGTALSGTQLNATANAAGVFTYFPGPGTVLEAGTQTLSATFTPTDITDYATATATVSLVVNADQSGQNTPVISWSTPAAISYGTPLSSAQLNASASYNGTSVLGTFEYTPAAGEILETGSQVLVVAFFPTDSVHYSPVGGSVSLQVNASSIQPLAVYSYSITTPGGASGYSSNSNLQNYTDSVTGTWSFNYDTLNRLVAGTPATGNNLCWSYDPFGNRTAQSSQSAACPTLPSVPTATASYNTNNQVTWTTVNAASSGFSYDAAGNVLSDNVNTYIYDGEGRVCAVKSEPVSGTFIMTEYIYDAEGNRVGKGTLASWPLNGLCPDVTAAGVFTPTNSYVLGPSNEQLTETDGNGNWIHSNVYAEGMLVATYDIAPTGDPALHFQLEDWLGSRRVQTDISGNPEQNFISLPFGDGLATIVPSGAPLTADDATEHHFTGKERDAESGNDYFGARYYASTMGRFLSPDWAAKATPVPYAKLDNPQSLNLYAYVGNNPLSRVDPDGHCDAPSGLKPGQVGICVASYIRTTWFKLIGRGDGRDTNGNGGTARIETHLVVDPKTGKVTNQGDVVGRSGVLLKDVGPKGTGQSQNTQGTVDAQGNTHFQVSQDAHSFYAADGKFLGSIDNHLNLEVTPDQKVGIDAGSTARDFPSLEVYRYTTDGTTMTTTLVTNRYEAGNGDALKQPETPLPTQAPQ